MPRWDLERLGLLAEFRNGLNYTDADQGDGLAVVGVSDFKDNVVADLSALAQLNLSALGKADALIRKEDIIFVRSNGNRELIGRSMFVADAPKMATSHSGFTIRCRFHDQRCHPRFYAYFLRGPIVRQTLSAHGGGTNISNLNQGILASLLVPIPDYGTQERIAEILSAYDDLIENNTRRTAILEEMARRIYEEWFVYFRAPGCKDLTFIDSPLGLIPEGWAATVSVIAGYINRGIAPKYDETSQTVVINQKCIRDGRLSLEAARSQSKSVPAEKLAQHLDVLINSTGVGTLGRAAQAFRPPFGCTVDSHVTIARPKLEIDPHFFGLTLLRLQPKFEAAGVGSTGQTELSRDRIRSEAVVNPPQSLQRAFGEQVEPMRELANSLSLQNRNLRAQRDLLLPKLISGEIDVSEAEELMEAAE
jgi:type I restriction enzyme S subunit